MSLQSLVTLCFVLLSGSYAQNVQVSFTTTSPLAERFVTATCTVTNLQPSQSIASVSWRHNGTVIVDGGRTTIANEFAASRSRLDINNLVPSDSGEYTCSMQLQNPTREVTDVATIEIQTAPTVAANREQVALEGETAIIRCNVTSMLDARINWYRGPEGNEVLLGVQLSSDPNFGMWMIPDVQGSNAGRYRCEGENSVDTASRVIQLVVLIPPNITNDVLVDHAVDKGSDLVLDCNATGVRDPTYTWFFNGQNLTEVNNERIQVNQSTGVLIIRETVFFDYGNYTCFAGNEVGNDTQDNTIVIQGSPEIVTPLNESVITNIIVGVGEDAEFRCNFLAYPNASTRWFRVMGQMRDELDINANGRYQVGENGTLKLMDVRVTDAGMYSCEVSNEFGNDTRMQTLMIIERPISPSNLFQTVVDGNPFSLMLNWTQHPPPAQNREVESFVVELSTDGGTTFQVSEQRFPSNVTSGVLVNLIPGETFSIRLRASNLGGISDPSNVVSYVTPNGAPRLGSFNAVAQDGGRSVLLEWKLEYDGGGEVNTIAVEVYRNGVLINTLRPPFALGRYTVSGLDPETSYRFGATVSNAFGRSRSPLYGSAVTTVGPPSKPTTPIINATTIQTLTFSFSVDFGSSPIRFFLLNITEYPNGTPNTLNISADDDTSGMIRSLTMFERRQTILAYYVEMRLSSQLNNQVDYVFAVAAENDIGVGEFSNASNPARLEDARALYGIIAGVVGGLLLVVIIIIVVIVIIAVRKKKKNKTTGKMNISVSYGTRPSTAAETDEFVLQSPPLGKSAKSNDYQEQRPEDPPSPYYNCLSKYQNGLQEQLKQDPGVDVPDTGVKYFQYNPRPVPNPAYNDHIPTNLGQPSPKSPHQTSLPRSLTNYQQGNGYTGSKQYPESVVSDKQFPTSPIHVTPLRDPLSKSTPLITDRYSDSLPKPAMSYMTDV